jgi:hypothetical protein
LDAKKVETVSSDVRPMVCMQDNTNTRDGIPEGYERLDRVSAVFVNRKTGSLVIEGNPPDNEDETGHNCDLMGCRCCHVIATAKVMNIDDAGVLLEEAE